MDATLKICLLAFVGVALLGVGRQGYAQQAKAEPRQSQAEDEPALADGRQIFASRCAGCHGLDARGGERAPDIATRPTLQQQSDAELARIIKAGVPAAGMPAFATLDDSAVVALVRYVRFLQGNTGAAKLPGVPERGKTVFFGAGHCAQCHFVNGQGGFIASDLSAFARTRSAEEIRDAITKPTEDPRRNAVVDVSTKHGETLSGIIRNEDNFSLQVQSLDGRFHFLLRSEITSLGPRQESLMPSDYRWKLNRGELDDLISFLMSVANDGKPAIAKKKAAEGEEDP
jgi:cytochrome c oxidase cbb3-type subunit III